MEGSSFSKFAVRYGPSFPVPGKLSEEASMRPALARFRRILMTEIPVKGVSGVLVRSNESSLDSGDLKGRFLGVLVPGDYPEDELYLEVTAPPDTPMSVTSDMIRDKNGNPAPVLPGVPFSALAPGKRLSLVLNLATGTYTKRGVGFSIVPVATFYQVEDTDDYIFEFELVRGFTDALPVYEVAKEIAIQNAKEFKPLEIEEAPVPSVARVKLGPLESLM